MAVLPIRTVPDPILRKKTRRVSTIDKSIKKLVADMRETLHVEDGVLDLVQVDALAREEHADLVALPQAELAAKLETLGPGLWEHIDHAATDDPEIRALAQAIISVRFLNGASALATKLFAL